MAFHLSLQCRGREDGLFHCSGHHVGHGRERRRGGHFQLHPRAAITASQHGPDGGWCAETETNRVFAKRFTAVEGWKMKHSCMIELFQRRMETLNHVGRTH